jgi:hypothetical protein
VLAGSSILVACAAPFVPEKGVLVVATPGLIAAIQQSVRKELDNPDAEFGGLVAFQTGAARYSACGKVREKKSSGELAAPLWFYAEANVRGAESGTAIYTPRLAVMQLTWIDAETFYTAFPLCRLQ